MNFENFTSDFTNSGFESALSGAIGLPLGSFSDGSTILGKVNDFWGSFTGTKAEVFLNDGKKTVAALKQAFQQTFLANPTLALNNYEKGLNFNKGRFTAALKNASQTKTRVGNQQSLNDVVKAIQELKTFISSKSKEYSFKVKQTLNDVYRVGKHQGAYSWKIYEVTKKQVSSTVQKASSIVGSFFGASDEKNTNSNKGNTNLIGLVIAAIVLFFLSKKSR